MSSRPRQARGNIRQVAQATGVSVATVSRVMNGSDKVSPATRERVIEISRKLGYVPNPAAKALATNRSRVIGVVVPTLAHSIFATFLDELEQEFSKLRFSVVIAMSNGNLTEEHARARDMLAMGAEALVLSGAEHADGLLELIALHQTPVVYTSIFSRTSKVPMIGYDNKGLASQAAQFLIDLGHSRIAVLHGPAASNDRTRLRIKGVRDAVRRSASDVAVEFCPTSLDSAGGVTATKAVLSGGFKPTAILGLSDVLALGALFESPRHGLVVPDDLSIMGFDDLAWSAFTNPALTTVSLPTQEMGVVVAQKLAAFLDHAEPITSQRLDAAIIERGSTSKPKGKS